MDISQATDLMNQRFAEILFRVKTPHEIQNEVADCLEVYSNEDTLIQGNDIQGYFQAIAIYIFEDVNPLVFPKILFLLSHPYGGSRKKENPTIEDFCIIQDLAHQKEWPLRARIKHFEEKGDINLVYGGFFHRHQERYHATLDKNQIRTTGKLAYTQVAGLAEEEFVLQDKAEIFYELSKNYDAYEEGFAMSADMFTQYN